jgi:CheY-like chemotaxis protein/nitrogen-specific signal transduction histidine kinase
VNEAALRAQAVESQIVLETAQRTAKARTTFIATMSHEIRTPLNAIVGFADLLAKTRLDTEQQAFVAVLQDNAAHLRRLVNDILDYARLESGKVHLTKEPFALRDFIAGVAMTTTALVTGRPVEVTFFVDPDLSSVFRGDVTRIRQVMLNILGNAAKFTERGSIALRVTEVGQSQDRSLIRFEVMDTGIGIAPDLHEKIFDFYERAELRELSGGAGSGVGLAVSRAIVRLMGGDIVVTSEPGCGSTFWFEIPLQIAQPLLPRSTPCLEGTAAEWRAPSLDILIAEDSEASRMLLTIMLQKLGHAVTPCVNGAEAVMAARAARFDVIILDLQMPVMGGIEAARLIRTLPADVGGRKIVALTADAFPERRIEALEAGMDQVINKPFEQAQLESMLAMV